MILLTDGEICYDKVSLSTLKVLLLHGGTRNDVSDIVDAALKAQLKKIADWGNEFCTCDIERDHPVHRHFCPKCWQALLKELSDIPKPRDTSW